MSKIAINSQVFDITCTSEKVARQVQQEIKYFLAPQLNRIMLKVIQDLVQENECLQIDKLEVDLGAVRLPELSQREIQDKFTIQFTQSLILNKHQQVEAVLKQAHYQSTDIPPTTDLAADYELIDTFCRQGDLPWWVEKKGTPALDTIIHRLINQDPANFKNWIMAQRLNPVAWFRLTTQFKLTTKTCLLSLMPDLLPDPVHVVGLPNFNLEAFGSIFSHAKILHLRSVLLESKKVTSAPYTTLLAKLSEPSNWTLLDQGNFFINFSGAELAFIKVFVKQPNQTLQPDRAKALKLLKRFTALEVEFLVIFLALEASSSSWKYRTKEDKPGINVTARVADQRIMPVNYSSRQPAAKYKTRPDVINTLFARPQPFKPIIFSPENQSVINSLIFHPANPIPRDNNPDPLKISPLASGKVPADNLEADNPVAGTPAATIIPAGVNAKSISESNLEISMPGAEVIKDSARKQPENKEILNLDESQPSEKSHLKEEIKIKEDSVLDKSISPTLAAKPKDVINQVVQTPNVFDQPANSSPRVHEELTERENAFTAKVVDLIKLSNSQNLDIPEEEQQRSLPQEKLPSQPDRQIPNYDSLFLAGNPPNFALISAQDSYPNGRTKQLVRSIFKKLSFSNPFLTELLQYWEKRDLLYLKATLAKHQHPNSEDRAMVKSLMAHPAMVKYNLLEVLAYLPLADFLKTFSKPDGGGAIKGNLKDLPQTEIKSLHNAQQVYVKARKKWSLPEKIILQDIFQKQKITAPTEEKVLRGILHRLPMECLLLLQFLVDLPEPLLVQFWPTEKLTPAYLFQGSKTDQFIADDPTHPGKVYLLNAGLCLIALYLPGLFAELGYLENKIFKNKYVATRALYLTQYLVTGKSVSPEYLLPLNKLICGFRLTDWVASGIRLTKKETTEANNLLEAVIGHWQALKNTSTSGLRQAFLQRAGILLEQESCWTLQVERKGQDMLLNTLPWGYNMIKLPWMKKMLKVEW